MFGPWVETEIHANGGLGFHSNDPLVRTKGAELGMRTLALEGLQSTVSLWVLESDSEILFVGDAGSTEAAGGYIHGGVLWRLDDPELNEAQGILLGLDIRAVWTPEYESIELALVSGFGH